ncbi:hypothetical protein BDW59DRAFT_166809 [Aspergillus cavernicola]|uniref:Uncharacterized protein n=1 Tax=Aspergillus cavernicola TaxID=176166 RepID=A0ABR4HIV1_9EURO
MPSDTLIPILIALPSDINTHQVVLVDENTASFEDLATNLYAGLRPNIDDFYLQSGERHITKAWVEWNQTPNQYFPLKTQFSDGNIRALLRYLDARRGIDIVRVWLNEVEEAEEAEEVEEYE